eukprot:SAG31_NODE_773_length_12173_cov_15.778173_10_plen_152_part_00
MVCRTTSASADSSVDDSPGSSEGMSSMSSKSPSSSSAESSSRREAPFRYRRFGAALSFVQPEAFSLSSIVPIARVCSIKSPAPPSASKSPSLYFLTRVTACKENWPSVCRRHRVRNAGQCTRIRCSVSLADLHGKQRRPKGLDRFVRALLS